MSCLCVVVDPAELLSTTATLSPSIVAATTTFAMENHPKY